MVEGRKDGNIEVLQHTAVWPSILLQARPTPAWIANPKFELVGFDR